ncbi:MAG: ABC transporter permease, partial [Clostridiales bacterium]|nr:ABC transporter permease [Clostridiales bacterium]
DYLVYFITIIRSVSMMFAFNALVFSEQIMQINDMFRNMGLIVVAASAVVVLIIGWLVYYTMNFMLHKRSRELGTYMLLGIEPKAVANLFFRENLLIGAAAFAVGILFGNLVFQGLQAIILRMFGAQFRLVFDFKPQTVGLTLLYGMLIYLFALWRCRRKIASMKVYDLLYAERRNERQITRSKWRNRLLFLSAMAAGGAGLALLARAPYAASSITAQNMVIGAVLLLIYFLFAFYFSISGAITRAFAEHPRRKYRGESMFLFRALTSKVNSMTVTMTVLALLFTLTMAGIGFGAVFSDVFDRRVEMLAFDLSIGFTDSRAEADEYLAYVEEHVDVRADHLYPIYQGDARQVSDLLETNHLGPIYYDTDLVMKYSDYAVLREMLDLEPVVLNSGSYLFHCVSRAEKVLQQYAQEETVTVGGQALRFQGIYTEDFSQYYWTSNGRNFLIVAPDDAVEDLQMEHRIYAAMTDTPVEEAVEIGLREIGRRQAAQFGYDSEWDVLDLVLSKYVEKQQSLGSYVLIVFPLYYLALILMMTAATILTTQQLSDASKYRYQYQTLRKLGMEERRIRRTVRRQMAVYFALPAVPPMILSSIIIFALSLGMDTGILLSVSQIPIFIGIAVGLFLAVYLIYFAAAYVSFRRNIAQ